MAGSEVFQLALLLNLKDFASGGLDRFRARLIAAGKDGEIFAKSLDHIRTEMNRGLAMGGIGLAGLDLMKKGIHAASDFQKAATDTRVTFAQLGKDGKINMDMLGKDMARATAQAMSLGQQFPGTTKDALETMTTLKQMGLTTEQVLGGTTEAVYKLGVATHARPQELAHDFGQLVNLFQLKGKETERAADLLSRMNLGLGMQSPEIIAGMSMFQGRTGAAMKFTGVHDAEGLMRIMGLFKRMGVEGTRAGTELDNFFTQYISHKKQVEKAGKEYGLHINLFDEKTGNFAGWDNIFKQLEPLNKLGDKQRAAALHSIFGIRGAGAGAVFLKAGVAGWKDLNDQLDKTILMSLHLDEVMKNLDAQVEALMGSLENLVVTAFTPLVPKITAAASTLNTFVGLTEDLAKAHPDLSSTIIQMSLLGAASLTLVGGFKAATGAFSLLKLASNFSSGEKAAVFFKQMATDSNGAAAAITKVEQSAGRLTAKESAIQALGGTIGKTAEKTGDLATKMTDAEKKTGRLRQTFQSFASSGVLKLAVETGAIMAAIELVSAVAQNIAEQNTRAANLKQNLAEAKGIYDDILSRGGKYNDPNDPAPKKSAIAEKFFQDFDFGGLLVKKLHPERMSPDDSYFKQLTGANFLDDIVRSSPWGSSPTGKKGFANSTGMVDFNPTTAARWLQQQGQGYITRDPQTLAEALKGVNEYAAKNNLNQDDIKMLTAAIEKLAELEGHKHNLDAANELIKNEKKPEPAYTQKGWMTEMPRTVFPKINQLSNPWGIVPFDFGHPLPWMGAAPRSDFRLPTGAVGSEPFKFGGGVPSLLKDMKEPKAGKPGPDLFPGLKLFEQPVADTAKQFSMLTEQTTKTGESLTKIIDPAGKTAEKFGSIISSVDSVNNALLTLSTNISSWKPPAAAGPAGNTSDTSVASPTSFSAGGHFKRTTLAAVHTRKTEGLLKSDSRGGGGTKVQQVNHIHIHGSDEAAQASFQQKLDDNAGHLERLFTRAIDNGRVRA